MFEGASPGLLWNTIMPSSLHSLYTTHCFILLQDFLTELPETTPALHPPLSALNNHLLLCFVFVNMGNLLQLRLPYTPDPFACISQVLG